MRFTNGYMSGPYCSMRAGLMTALNDGGEGGKGCGLPFSEKTTADRLKAMGYAT